MDAYCKDRLSSRSEPLFIGDTDDFGAGASLDSDNDRLFSGVLASAIYQLSVNCKKPKESIFGKHEQECQPTIRLETQFRIVDLALFESK
ncbi:unnamed protein product [Protopolystoma xenopodis]|uniref:Uncharacterized protein n=1 Tax=Protopolystoma xenopodis TaxID=117903 RepID=A0A3S5ABN1_9PLAT|nr:unnamed protein product [Protopolystoma xenopodis]